LIDATNSSATSNSPAGYAFPTKALRRWSDQFLEIDPQEDGAIDATFHFEGNICNGTRVLRFDYQILLQPSADGFIIASAACRRAAADDNGSAMCEYGIRGDQLFKDIENEAPLVGCTLEEALAWDAPIESSACLCRQQQRNHKWRVVFHSLHFALHRQE